MPDNAHSAPLPFNRSVQWDIFCHVIDNFGDIGVSWRLARQLQHDYRQTIRLWVDDLYSLTRIAPQIKPDLPRQFFRNIEIRHWLSPFPACAPGDVVVEMFACTLPDAYVMAVTRKSRAPVWINLEYLSAEDWVPAYHGLRSPHPRLPLTKTFFFPGFVSGTGGLLRENDLIRHRTDFDDQKARQFWQSIGVPERAPRECRVSLFCYEHAPLKELIAIWMQSPMPIFLIVPQGRIADQVTAILNTRSVHSGEVITAGRLSVKIIPFLEQTQYDTLLWACDLNFVRGEDSFVRAQWAGKPFVWHIYPQSEQAHWKKLDAFLQLYTKQMPENVVYALRKFWHGWNGMAEIDASTWQDYRDCFAALESYNAAWRQTLAAQHDLAFNLVQFAGNQL